MNNNTLEFALKDEMAALAALIAALNQNGVPYSLNKDTHAVRITIGTGF
jgi:hypothetical protein